MNHILVLYDSITGHTKAMAEIVARGASCRGTVEVRLKTVDDAGADDILWCDGIAVGSPTHCGLMSWKMKRFWDSLVEEHWGRIDGKIGCAFSSSGGWGGGNEVACQSILTVLVNFGFLVFGVTDYTGKQMTLHYGAAMAGEPRDADEVLACERLGERLVQMVERAGSAEKIRK